MYICLNSFKLAHQLSDGHLGDVTQTQVHLIPADFILQVQHFAVFTHPGVRGEEVGSVAREETRRGFNATNKARQRGI